jgi:spermidine synthase
MEDGAKKEKLGTQILFLLSLGLNGFFILSLEIMGARLIAPYYGSTIFVWSSLITVTLGALALGYWIGGLVSERRKVPVAQELFYWFIAAGSALAFMIPAAASLVLPQLYALGYTFAPLVGAVILFLAPLLLLSAATTVAVQVAAMLSGKVASSAGNVFAISTMGSILGALASGFLLIPLVSIDTALQVMSALLLSVSLIGIVINRPLTARRSLIFVALAGLLFSTALFTGKHEKYLFRKDSLYGQVEVRIVPRYGRCLFVDQLFQGCQLSPYAKRSFPVFDNLIAPLALIKSSPKKVLFLGLGAAVCPNLIKGPNVDITVVEIDPVIEEVAANYFDFTPGKGVKIVIDDARVFLQRNEEQFDLVIIDLYRGASSDPFVWTKEMYELIKKSLRPDGIVSINSFGVLLQRGTLLDDFVATVKSVFPHVVVCSEFSAIFRNVVIYASQTNQLATLGDELQQQGAVITDRHNWVEYKHAASAIELMKYSKMFYPRRD